MSNAKFVGITELEEGVEFDSIINVNAITHIDLDRLLAISTIYFTDGTTVKTRDDIWEKFINILGLREDSNENN